MIAGQQNGRNAQFGKRRNRRRAFFAQGIGQRDVTGKRAVDRNISHRTALPDVILRFGRRCNLNAVLPKQIGISRQYALIFDPRAHAAAGDHFKILRRSKRRACFSTAAHDRLAQRVFG